MSHDNTFLDLKAVINQSVHFISLPWLRLPEKRRSSLITFILGSCCVIMLCIVVKYEQIREHGDVMSLKFPHEEKYKPLENIPQDRRKLAASGKKIPKIIHQTWKTEKIPSKFVSWVKTWGNNHPEWTYMLWTDESARRLIADKYSDFLPVFDKYDESIRKADALRYFVLYEYGGVYVDMDLESLKPLDDLVNTYACFLGQEPYEHPVIDGGFEHLIINAVMGCRRKHPFMKLVMDNLPFFSNMWNVLDSTGPHLITSLYKRYMSKDISKPEDSIFITPPDYFFPQVDPAKYFDFYFTCRRFTEISLLKKRACVSMKKRGKGGDIPDVSYANHHWVHTYIYTFRTVAPVDIHELIPEVVLY